MNVYLVRHGEAVSERVDSERPLTSAGRAEVERMARMAASRNVQVSAIFHSGILRAKQTAEILAEQLQFTLATEQLAGLLPQDDPDIAKAELEAAENPIMLVGHLPHLHRLIALLVRGEMGSEMMELPPATLVCMSKEGAKWRISWTLTSSVTHS